MKVVIDTNVLISGLMLPESVPGKILKEVKRERLKLVFSDAMLDEVERVLSYSKINKRLGWSAEKIQNFLLLLKLLHETVDISHTSAVVPKDNNDNMILATLIASNAKALITGDRALLELNQKHPIMTPAEFIQKFF